MGVDYTFLSHPCFGKSRTKHACCVCGLNVITDNMGRSYVIMWRYNRGECLRPISYLNVCGHCLKKSSKKLIRYLCKKSYFTNRTKI